MLNIIKSLESFGGFRLLLYFCTVLMKQEQLNKMEIEEKSLIEEAEKRAIISSKKYSTKEILDLSEQKTIGLMREQHSQIGQFMREKKVISQN